MPIYDAAVLVLGVGYDPAGGCSIPCGFRILTRPERSFRAPWTAEYRSRKHFDEVGIVGTGSVSVYQLHTDIGIERSWRFRSGMGNTRLIWF